MDKVAADKLVYVLRQTNQVRGLHTIIRDKNCTREVRSAPAFAPARYTFIYVSSLLPNFAFICSFSGYVWTRETRTRSILL